MSENEAVKSALSKAMTLCATHEYCSEDIRIKLSSWGIKDSDSEGILARLKKENFINDKRYAESFVADKYRYNKWGRLKISSHMRLKRLPSEVISAALDTIDEEEYRQNIREILASHKRVIKARNAYEMKGKLLRYGLSKGFESNILYDVLNEAE
jgi:regulatory protein